MFWLVLRPLRFFARAIVDQDSPRQLALGFALGMVVGLVPKGNLIAMSLLVIVGASRVNLGTTMLGTFVFSWVGMLLDPVSHELGLWLLTQESLSGVWTWFYNQPVVPWTRFNNTVVLGSFLLGWALFYPVYRLMESRFTVWQPKLAERFQKFKLTQILLGAEYASKLGGA